jgi:Ca2+-binding EF-hand superfamily protein
MKSPEQAAFKAILIVAVIIAIVAWPFVSHADSHRGGPPAFEDFDTDGDGFVSEQEFNTLRSERIAARAAEGRQMKGLANAPAFSTIDSNGDGKLDREEFTAGRDAHMKVMREKHGAKGKGGRGHGAGHSMPAFEDLDLDGDGCINAEEFAQHQASHHGKRHGQQQTQ